MRVRTLAIAPFLALCAVFPGCSPKESALVVRVSGVREGAKTLRLLSTFAGTPGKTSLVEPGTNEFTVAIPPDREGELVLEGMAQTPDDCYVSGNIIRVSFSAERQIQHRELNLIQYAQPMCPKVCSPAGWCWENPLPTGNELVTLWGDRPDNFWAVGSAGTILRWDGNRWVGMAGDRLDDLHGVWGSGSQAVFSVGLRGTIKSWDGHSWSSGASSGTMQHLFGVWGFSSSDVWAVGDQGVILHFDGSSWTPSSSEKKENLRRIWGSGPDDIWAVGVAGTILHLTDKTKPWTPEPQLEPRVTQDLIRVWGSGRDRVWAVGNGGTILHFNGTKWAPDGSPATQTLNGVWGSDANDVWAVGEGGKFFRRQNGSWGPVFSTSATDTLLGVWGSSPKDIWAIGSKGLMLHWNDREWSQASTSIAKGSLWSIWGSETGELWAAGQQGTILSRKEGVWSASRFPGWTDKDISCMRGLGADDLWSVDSAGAVGHWDGKSWQVRPPAGTGVALNSILEHSPGNVTAVGAGGRILHLNPAGSQFGDLMNVTSSLNSIWGVASDDFWIVGGMGTIIRVTMSAVKAPSLVSTDLWSIWGSSSGDVWAVGDGGVILRWTGGAWAVQPSGTVNSLRGLWGSSASAIWAVGEGGIVLYWNNSGWAPVASGCSPPLSAVWASPAGDVWAVGSAGSILHFKKP